MTDTKSTTRLKRLGTWLVRILVGLDRMVNAILGGNPAETLSSVAFRKHRDNGKWGPLMWLINGLFFSRTHCEDAYKSDRSQILPN